MTGEKEVELCEALRMHVSTRKARVGEIRGIHKVPRKDSVYLRTAQDRVYLHFDDFVRQFISPGGSDEIVESDF